MGSQGSADFGGMELHSHVCPVIGRHPRGRLPAPCLNADDSGFGSRGKASCPYLPEVSLQLVGFFLSFGIISLLFAMMFKWLPDTPVAWSDVWLGAIVTAALFELGKLAIGLYIGKQGLESTYGAAASIVVVLIWVYYSSQIVLMGAEFTNVYARRYGSLRTTLSSMQNRND